MAWYNNWKDFTGDVGDILTGHNPMNNPPPVNIPDYGGSTTSSGVPKPYSTGQQTMAMTDPTDPLGNQGYDPTQDGSGGIDWGQLLGDVGGFFKDHAGDILKTGGSAANAYLDYITKQQALKERQREFDLQNQLGQGYQGITLQSLINRAPLADKGQYLALNNAAPTPFQPRDYTQGLNNIRGQATGGAAAQLAANQAASANYKPGMGGVDTSTLQTLLSRINLGKPTTNTTGATAAPGANLPPGASSVVGGTTQPMTQEEYDAWRAAHPNG